MLEQFKSDCVFIQKRIHTIEGRIKKKKMQIEIEVAANRLYQQRKMIAFTLFVINV